MEKETTPVHPKTTTGTTTKCALCPNCEKAARWNCVQCKVEMCDNGRELHNFFPLHRSHSLVPISVTSGHLSKDAIPSVSTKPDTPRYCKEHPEHTFALYCETCKELICGKCVLNHKGCALEDIDTAVEKEKEQTKQLLHKLNEERTQLTDLDGSITKEEGTLNTTGCEASEQVLKHNSEIRERLKNRESVLVKQGTTLVNTKTDILKQHKTQVTDIISCIDNISVRVDTLMNANDQHQSIQVFDINKDMRQLIDHINHCDVKRKVESGLIVFSVDSAKIVQLIDEMGCVLSKDDYERVQQQLIERENHEREMKEQEEAQRKQLEEQRRNEVEELHQQLEAKVIEGQAQEQLIKQQEERQRKERDDMDRKEQQQQRAIDQLQQQVKQLEERQRKERDDMGRKEQQQQRAIDQLQQQVKQQEQLIYELEAPRREAERQKIEEQEQRPRTCSNCKDTFTLRDNSDTACKYHPGIWLRWDFWSCCNATGRDAPGCKTGRHEEK